jgi:hypothetical protein
MMANAEIEIDLLRSADTMVALMNPKALNIMLSSGRKIVHS